MTLITRPIDLSHPAWKRAARVEAWTEQDCNCCYCKAPLTRDELTAEHKEARKHGGSDERRNIAAACRWCNEGRGSLPKAKFMKLLKSPAPSPYFAIRMAQISYRIERRTRTAVKRVRNWRRM